MLLFHQIHTLPCGVPPSSDLLESSSKKLGANVDCNIKLSWPGHFTKQSPDETFSLHNVIYVAPQAVKFANVMVQSLLHSL